MANENQTSVFSILQKIGQALMVPVSVLPAAGLMVALGRVLQNAAGQQIAGQAPTLLFSLGKVCYSGGLAIFEQLPVVFSVGVTIGFTGGAGIAGLASVAGYFTLINVLKVITETRQLTLPIDTGVFGGIAVGLLAANLYNKFHKTKLHPVLGFFSGKRLVPIVTVGASICLAFVLGVVWPPIQAQIDSFGNFVMGSNLGPAFYAAGKRLLIPLGLHHVYYPPFLFKFGEFTTAAGQVLHGESARYFAGDPTAGRFMASEYPLMLFALPAAALAMVLRAKPERRKAVAGVMTTAALTSIITGITEPIEFAFIFVAPILFVFHVLTAFVGGYLTGLFDVHLGYTFSASIIDYFLGYFNQHNSMYLWAVVGPAMALLYFTVFYTAIGYFNFKTPGREDAEELSNNNMVDASDKAAEILVALGGAENIKNLDACITRLRTTVNKPEAVNIPRLKELGAAGVLNAGKGNFQVIFGVESDHLKDQINSLIATKPKFVPGPEILFSPMTGKMVALENVPDETFAQKTMGDGFAIDPQEGVVLSPVDGEVATVFRTNHAVGLRTDKGLEVLIHVGIDTVQMKGQGFKSFVKAGDKVKQGTKLLEFDIDAVRSQAKSLITPVIVTNPDAVKDLKVLAQGQVSKNQKLAQVEINA